MFLYYILFPTHTFSKLDEGNGTEKLLYYMRHKEFAYYDTSTTLKLQ